MKKWNSELGEQRAMQMINSCFGRPPIYARVNTVRYTVDDVIGELESEGISATKNSLIDACIELANTKGIEQSSAYKKGMFHIQDISSQICCKIAAPVFNETVVDLCSAPGGKTFTCAEIMNDRGRIYSYDLYDGKVSVIANTAKRLDLTIITAAENDATKFNPGIPKADRVICDVPCSGLGVIRRKPEIKYKPMKQLETLPDIFIDLKLYKKVIYYSAVFYISALFFNTDIQNTEYLCALSQIMDDLVHNYTIYSDDNRLMLLYQLANQQLLAGKIDEAQKTVEEA